jgi:hypothetical protein
MVDFGARRAPPPRIGFEHDPPPRRNSLGLQADVAAKMGRAGRKLCEPLHTHKFFYKYLWLIVEMQYRKPSRIPGSNCPEGNRYARFDPPATSDLCR